jgi:hypothetical protein
MLEFLPRYIAADMSGGLPPVPVLVDAQVPESVRRCFEVMVRAGVEIIAVPPYVTVRVGRLWCGPSLHYAPAYEIMDADFRWDFLCPSPAQFRPVVREIARRATILPSEPASPARVFLGRRPHLWRKVVNAAAIEAAAAARGFAMVYPEELGFDRQVDLIRQARFVVAPEGSALFLLYFARPGTKLCILDHPWIDEAISYNGMFDGVEITIVTGPIVRSHAEFPHRADYEIDETVFCDFLDDWT